MRLSIGEHTYIVHWTHINKKKFNLLSGKDVNGETICRIKEGDTVLLQGKSICHLKDQYNKATGRKRSLKLAMEGHLEAEDRVKFWKAYKEQVGFRSNKSKVKV